MFDEEFHWLCSHSSGLILQNQSSPKADLRLGLECQTVLPFGYYDVKGLWLAGKNDDSVVTKQCEPVSSPDRSI